MVGIGGMEKRRGGTGKGSGVERSSGRRKEEGEGKKSECSGGVTFWVRGVHGGCVGDLLFTVALQKYALQRIGRMTERRGGR